MALLFHFDREKVTTEVMRISGSVTPGPSDDGRAVENKKLSATPTYFSSVLQAALEMALQSDARSSDARSSGPIGIGDLTVTANWTRHSTAVGDLTAHGVIRRNILHYDDRTSVGV